MAVNTVEIESVYDSMMGKIIESLDAALADSKITSDLYSKALVASLQPTMQLATTTVQQQPLIEAQTSKTVADESFTATQEDELINSVLFNNKIKALDSYGDMIGTMGAGSLSISTDMWTAFFGMVNDLNSSSGIPADTTVTKL